MVQGRSIIAGIFGVICAIAILGLLGLTQAGAVFNPSALVSHSLVPSQSSSSLNSAVVSSTTGTSSNNTATSQGTASPSYFYGMAGLSPLRDSQQTIGSFPSTASSVLLLGVISLIVSLGVVFGVSRRLNGSDNLS